MQNEEIELRLEREQPLDKWVDDILKPVLSAIGYVNLYLENLYRELE